MNMNKFYLWLMLIIFSINNVSGSLLISQDNYNIFSEPQYVINFCDLSKYCLCITSNNSISGQIIKIEDNFKTIDSLKFYMQKLSNDKSYTGTIILKVYKSTTADPQTATLTLWETINLNPTSLSITENTIFFTYPIPVYGGINEDEKILNYLFITIEETYPDIDDTNLIGYGFLRMSSDYYSDGKLYQKYNNIWTSFDDMYYDINGNLYHDLTFKLYGTYKTSPNPEWPDNEYDPCVEGNCSVPVPAPDGVLPDFSNDFIEEINYTDFTKPSQNCEFCQGNETKIIKGGLGKSDTGFGQTLSGLGYCQKSNCTMDDFIDFLYDWSIGFFLISLIFLFNKMR